MLGSIFFALIISILSEKWQIFASFHSKYFFNRSQFLQFFISFGLQSFSTHFIIETEKEKKELSAFAKFRSS
jgi:hypothetical protein